MYDLIERFRMPDRFDVSFLYFSLFTALGLAMTLFGGIGEWRDYRRRHSKPGTSKHDD